MSVSGFQNGLPMLKLYRGLDDLDKGLVALNKCQLAESIAGASHWFFYLQSKGKLQVNT